MDDDKTFEANEIRFWSVKTFFKFLLFGLPRVFLLLIFLIILLIIFLIFNNNSLYTSLTPIAATIFLFFSGYKDNIIDKKSLEIIKNSKAQIIVSSHPSYMDAFVLMKLFPDAKFIASNFVKNIPIINKLFEKKGIYLKTEFSGNLTDLIAEELKNGQRIIFFSAGVCHNPDYVIGFRNGAFVPKMNILPIHISYSNNEYFVNGENDMVYHILNHLSNRKNKFTLRALKEYEISEEEKNGSIEDFKENFRKYYADGFNLKLSNKNYKDHPYFKLVSESENNKPEKN
jgi:1-acyl-sn-glycerol-3-phosphate acyltransferase